MIAIRLIEIDGERWASLDIGSWLHLRVEYEPRYCGIKWVVGFRIVRRHRLISVFVR